MYILRFFNIKFDTEKIQNVPLLHSYTSLISQLIGLDSLLTQQAENLLETFNSELGI